MKRVIALVIVFFTCSSHDLFLKMDTYIFKPNQKAIIHFFNGTFEKSDGAIARTRMADASLLSKGMRIAIDTANFEDIDSTMTALYFTTGAEGTWLAGISTKAKILAQESSKFNDYLVHDGLIDMLEWRKKNNAMDLNAVEEYSKHVKAVFQVGNEKTDDCKAVLGYPIEFVLLDNPYDLHPGHDLKIQLLLHGKPLANQLVYFGTGQSEPSNADSEHGHSHEHLNEHEHVHTNTENAEHLKISPDTIKTDHKLDHVDGLRTDEKGIVNIHLKEKGIYYVKTIYINTISRPGLTHESLWSSITFEIGDGHSHSHDHHQSIPLFVYVLSSIVLIVGLYFWFNKKKDEK